MKRALLFLFLIAFVSFITTAQDMVSPNRPPENADSQSDFVSINELTYGLGLGLTDVSYSRRYFGFTTINGIHVNKNFIAAAGTGFLIYDEGMLIPLFLDFRYIFNLDPVTPYLYADGGFLLDFKDFKNGTKQFLNPGVGVKYAFSSDMAANLGVGVLMQNNGYRDTFFNFNLGVSYNF